MIQSISLFFNIVSIFIFRHLSKQDNSFCNVSPRMDAARDCSDRVLLTFHLGRFDIRVFRTRFHGEHNEKFESLTLGH